MLTKDTATMTLPPLEHYAALVPKFMLPMSGGVFASGRASVSHEQPLMIIGLNPGGNPEDYQERTVAACIHRALYEHVIGYSPLGSSTGNY